MTDRPFSLFCSNRVEFFASWMLQALFETLEIATPSEDQCKILMNSSDAPTILQKAKTFMVLKHRGRYGPLEKSVQEQLNLELLILDVTGRSQKSSHALIKQMIKHNDAFVQKKQTLRFNEDLFSNLIDDLEGIESGFEWFLRKADNLLTFQKLRIRQQTETDEENHQHLQKLYEIYQKYLDSALAIQQNRLKKHEKKFGL